MRNKKWDADKRRWTQISFWQKSNPAKPEPNRML
jgi:hypothetical protein